MILPEFPKEGTLNEQIACLLAYAVRAPSTHNTQPWLFQLEGNDVLIFRDHSRRLPEGDPTGRYMLISIGALIEHLIIAAKYFDMFEGIAIGDLSARDGVVARITLRSSRGNNDVFAPIFRAIAARYNARGPSLDRQIPDTLLDQIVGGYAGGGLHSFVLRHDTEKKFFAELTARGMRHVHARPAFRRELANWIRSNYSKTPDGIPGYAMLAPDLLSLALPWLIGTLNCGSILAKLNRKSILSAPTVIVFATKDDTPQAWLSVGRRFAEVALLAATDGASASVFVASIEVPELREELRHYLRTDLFPQFTFTLGYPKLLLPPTPRIHPIERMISSSTT